jgi:hypothetical protein
VVGTYTAPGSLVSRAFALPWMTYLGKISYGIYLWHYPVLLVLGMLFEVRPVVVATMALVLSVAMASMSYQLLETPIRRGRVLDPFPWPSVAVGLAVSVLAAVAVVGPILTSDRQPSVAAQLGTSTTGRVAAVADKEASRQLEDPVPADLDYRELNGDRGHDETWCRPSAPEDCLVVDNDGPHVVVVGDSHARMLSRAFTTLAEEEGFRLSMSVVSSCPWQDGLYNLKVGPEAQQVCLEARRGFYERTLRRMDAEVVILANFPRSDERWEGKIGSYAGDEGPLHEMQRDAVQRTVGRINDAGASAVMVKSILGTGSWEEDGFDPLDCLARAKRQADCAVAPPLGRPVADALYENAAIGNDRAATVDINPFICPDAPACRPIIDGVVVWRDDRHLTARIATHLRREIWHAVRDTGVLDG